MDNVRVSKGKGKTWVEQHGQGVGAVRLSTIKRVFEACLGAGGAGGMFPSWYVQHG